MTFRPTPPSKTKRLHSLLGELGEAKSPHQQLRALFLLFAHLKDIEKKIQREGAKIVDIPKRLGSNQE